MPDLEIVVKKPEQADDISKNAVGETPATKAEQGKLSAQQKAVNAAIVSVGKQVIMSGVSQYGNITGDYTLGRAMSNATQLIGDVLIVAKGGPVGVLAVTGKYAVQMFSATADLNNRRIEVDLQRQRAGAISTKGSRY